MLADREPVEHSADRPFHIMVVDDSAVIRGLLTRILDADPRCEVVASAGNGQNALLALRRKPVDVILLDIEMPVMDGLTAIPLLLEACPDVRIIMVSTLTTQNAEIGVQALERGAHDYIPKPTSNRDLAGGSDFSSELLRKVTSHAEDARREGTTVRPVAARRPVEVPLERPAPSVPSSRGKNVVLRKSAIVHPKVIAIGSSTGGPKALTEVLASLDDSVTQPIFITQHMPPTFTAMLSQHISKAARRSCQEGADGMTVQPGNIYLAPGGFHMTVNGTPQSAAIALNQDPPENFCRPAVDPMLRSISAVYGSQILVVILTGMGSDGQLGCVPLAEAGATIIAQDEATSTVWGMPGAVATAGLCNEVLPLPEIGKRISEIAMGKRP